MPQQFTTKIDGKILPVVIAHELRNSDGSYCSTEYRLIDRWGHTQVLENCYETPTDEIERILGVGTEWLLVQGEDLPSISAEQENKTKNWVALNDAISQLRGVMDKL